MTTLVNELEFKYVLCAVESRIWTGCITDSDSTVELIKSKDADSDAGKFMKTLVQSSALARVRNCVNKARAALYASSVPWLASSHLVKMDRMEAINKVIGEHVAEFDSAVEKFLDDYPKLVEGASKRLGKLFNAADYPTITALRQKFSLYVVWLPVSQVNSSQMSILDGAVAKAVADSAKAATDKALKAAKEETLAKARKTVLEVAGVLKTYGEKKKAGDRAVLHESRVDSLRDTASNLVDYTFGDAYNYERVKEIATELHEVAAEGVDSLKENEAARKTSVDRLAEIEARLASMQAI